MALTCGNARFAVHDCVIAGADDGPHGSSSRKGSSTRLLTSTRHACQAYGTGSVGCSRSIDLALLESIWTAQENVSVQRMLNAAAVGLAHAVLRQLEAIVEQTVADHLIMASAVHDHGASLRSYELLAAL